MFDSDPSALDLPCDRLYFLHIPKTGGTSLRYWLDDLFANEDRLKCDLIGQVNRFDLEKINRHRFFSGHFGYKIFDYLDGPIPTVTWLRAPLSREISQYQFIRSRYDELVKIARDNHQPAWIEYYDLVRSRPLAEICQANYFVGYNDNLQTRYLSGAFPCDNATNVDRAMLEQAKSNLSKLWFVGICEWMAPSIDLLSHKLACPRRQLSIRSNKTIALSNDLATILTDPEQNAILEVNRFDVELYDYARALFADRFLEFWKTLPIASGTLPTVDGILARYADPQIDLAIKQAVDANFQMRRRKIPQSNSVDVEFARANFFSGWYPRDAGKFNKVIRWAGPAHASSIFVPIDPHRSYHFSCDAHYVVSYPILKNLTLRIGEQRFPTEWHQINDSRGGHFYKINGFIPRDVLCEDDAFTEIILETCESVEVEIPNDQTRRVSLATDGFHLKAA